jgi:hypothetical protein
MRLINVNNGLLEVFFDKQIPPYAILSHTWTEEEVLYSDMIPFPSDETKAKIGFEKIRRTARLARKANPPLQYIWVRTFSSPR